VKELDDLIVEMEANGPDSDYDFLSMDYQRLLRAFKEALPGMYSADQKLHVISAAIHEHNAVPLRQLFSVHGVFLRHLGHLGVHDGQIAVCNDLHRSER